ncbi:MAG: hypothetical protein V1794_02505 [Candidatus Glassbacteria bacterium]
MAFIKKGNARLTGTTKRIDQKSGMVNDCKTGEKYKLLVSKSNPYVKKRG